MKKIPIRRSSALNVILFALICLQAPLVHAQAAGKSRGYVESVDVKKKTLVLDKKKGQESLVWSDSVRVKSPVAKTPGDLKKGMWVLCFLNEAGEVITVRHNPEQDKPDE